MNAQHKLGRMGNRLRRIGRRIFELQADKAVEVQIANEHKRAPVLHGILGTINRLKRREKELKAMLSYE